MSEISETRQNIRCSANKADRQCVCESAHISRRSVWMVLWLLRLSREKILRADVSRLCCSLLDINASILAARHRAANFEINASGVSIQLIPPPDSGRLLLKFEETLESVPQNRPINSDLQTRCQADKLLHPIRVGASLLETIKELLYLCDLFFGHIKSKRVALTPNIPSSATPQAGLEPRKRNGSEQ